MLNSNSNCMLFETTCNYNAKCSLDRTLITVNIDHPNVIPNIQSHTLRSKTKLKVWHRSPPIYSPNVLELTACVIVPRHNEVLAW